MKMLTELTDAFVYVGWLHREVHSMMMFDALMSQCRLTGVLGVLSLSSILQTPFWSIRFYF